MKLRALTLRQFRNIEDTTIAADPHLNLLVGANGQGKTSFLEALGFLATLRSFRGAKTAEVIRYGQPTAEILAQVGLEDGPGDEGGDWLTELRIVFSGPENTKVAFINGKPFKSSTSYLSQRFGQVELGFHTVVFNPSDHDLVRGEPAVRRAYLDRVIAAEDIEYLRTVSRYQKLLQQRNALLKDEERPPASLLEGFTEPLARYGAWIVDRRLDWLGRVGERLDPMLHRIAPREARLEVSYVSKWAPDARTGPEALERAFIEHLHAGHAAELRAGTTLVGPHRDDWSFVLGSQPLKGHGSQGEVRSALLALKLCEIELFRAKTGHRPLMLLDDFSSELDQERRAFLMNFLDETDLQVFVTTTEDSIGVGKRFRIHDGCARIESAPFLGPLSELQIAEI